MSHLLPDLKDSLRMLVRTPGFTAVARRAMRVDPLVALRYE